MSWLREFCTSQITPCLIIFLLILMGTFIEKIRIFRIQIGHAGILGLSLICGYWIAKYPNTEVISTFEICPFLSTFSTALFIAVIGLEAGTSFSIHKINRDIKAFFSGMCVVSSGALMAFLILQFFPTSEKAMVLGLFTGSMTSTPTLSIAQELCGLESAVTLGYSLSYWIGLTLIVVFVQIFYNKHNTPQTSKKEIHLQNANRDQTETLFVLSLVIVCGHIVGWMIPIGNAGSTLVCGFLCGLILVKKEKPISNLSSYKKMGLNLLLICSGLSAGKQIFFNRISPFLGYGVLISLGAILIGYILIRFLLKFSNNETLILLSGGMTSTPAIATLEEKDKNIDLSLYALSYTGALAALFITIHVLFQN